MMRGKLYTAHSKSRPMTEEELEIAQWRIDDTKSGEWKIEEIYSPKYWKDQPYKHAFGGVFKKAVTDRKLKNIRLKIEEGYEILSSDRQSLYLVKMPQ